MTENARKYLELMVELDHIRAKPVSSTRDILENTQRDLLDDAWYSLSADDMASIRDRHWRIHPFERFLNLWKTP